MTLPLENTLPASREPLRVGSIISDALGIVSRNILAFAVLTAPILIAYGIYFLFLIRAMGAQAASFTPGLVPDVSLFVYMYLWMIPIYLVAIGSFNAISIYAAGKWNGYRQPLFASLLSGALRVPHVLAIWILMAVPPLILIGIVTAMAAGLHNSLELSEAFLWLGIFAIWIFLFPFVLAPQACLLGGSGPIAAFGQSARLTKHYRWRLFGLLILAWLVFVLLMLASMVVLVIFRFIPLLGAIVSLLTFLVMLTLTFSWFGTILAIAHGRLNLIKNGVPQQKIADIFD